MQFKRSIFFILLLCVGLLYTHKAWSQQSQQYRIANHLMNQQKYQQAYQILSELIQKHPGRQVLYKKSVDCLINLKRYDTAINLSKKRIKNGYSPKKTRIRLGALYHLKGDTTQAFQTWKRVLENHVNELQTYLQVARSMKQRNEYDKAINVYHRAQKNFNNDQLFANELAYTYQRAGNYEKAIQQYLQLIKKNPGRSEFVKRSLMRFKGGYLYEVAIVEFDKFLNNLPVRHNAYRPLHQLYQWILLEMNLYERALAAARNYEKKTKPTTFALFNLGNRLLSLQKYKLAKEAFLFYQSSSNAVIRRKSKEKLGDVYLQWADYLSDYNLVKTDQRDSLYEKAYQTYTALIKKHPGYRQVGRVLLKQAELALDHLKKVEKAETYLQLMKNSEQIAKARIDYVTGRIKLFRNQFDRARIAFTNANQSAERDQLIQKSRYYLALTDFYAGDFEYTKLQLKALEQQTTSYYANDAIRLRMWIQDGMQKDSATAELRKFANAIHFLEHGKMLSAIERLKSWVSAGASNALADDAILALTNHSTSSMVPAIYTLLDKFVSSGRNSPLRERLLWERARMGEQIVEENMQKKFQIAPRKNDLTAEEQFFQAKNQLSSPPENKSDVRQLYEKLLLEYPHGFYAAFARQRIKQLQNKQT